MVGDILEVSKFSRIPLGLQKAAIDSFKCAMCLHIAKPPVMVTKCCRNILGCSQCVNDLYSGDDALSKPCPLCRTARGYAEVMVLNGLDPFLNLINRFECFSEEDQTETAH